MITGVLSNITPAVMGRLVGRESSFEGVSTDSRTLQRGQLFVALRGERFDGHNGVPEAIEKGAAAVLVCALNAEIKIPAVVVDDTRRALGLLAQYWRRKFTLPVVAITGSNGKTTTKEMTAAILRQRGEVLATQGNLNNDIGVPLTLFRMSSTDKFAVIEMGANRPQDIADLVAIAEPTIGVVTMAGPAHLEGLGSVRGVAETKGRIYEKLGATGTAIINADDEYASHWRTQAADARVSTFGLQHNADFSATGITHYAIGEGSQFELHSPLGNVLIRLRVDGQHNIYNALAASAASLATGANLNDIQTGLATVNPVHGRLETRRAASGALIIDDSYNANLGSLVAGLAVLARSAGTHWLVLGDMGELGHAESSAHFDAGIAAREAGVERMFTIGARAEAAGHAFGSGAVHCADTKSLTNLLNSSLHAGVVVLVKGSRIMQLDRVVVALTEKEYSRC